MKKCPDCGREYPDDIERCEFDQQTLGPGDISPPLPSVPPVIAAPIQIGLLTERQFQIFELFLVCAVAFGSSILVSVGEGSRMLSHLGGRSEITWVRSCVHETCSLLLLWYVLRRRFKNFSNIGFSCKLTDVGWSFLLFILGSFVSHGIYHALYSSGLTDTPHSMANARVGQYLFGDSVGIVAILFSFLNPFYEELIVRAYVMTEVKLLANSKFIAIALSTAIQTSYHFYQGVPNALSLGGIFLISSLFFAWKNRIFPIILAHLYMDVGAALFYHYSHQ